MLPTYGNKTKKNKNKTFDEIKHAGGKADEADL
jgi:hypothetical protein